MVDPRLPIRFEGYDSIRVEDKDKNIYGLTPAQEEFCRLLSTYDDRGRLMSQRKAYAKAFNQPFDRKNGGKVDKGANALMRVPAIKARIKALLAESQKMVLEKANSEGIALIAARVARRNRDWQKIEDIKKERGLAAQFFVKRINVLQKELDESTDLEIRAAIAVRLDTMMEVFKETAGAETGLLKEVIRVIDGRTFRTWELDKDLLATQLALEEAVAKDLGQHKTNLDIGVTVKAYANFDPDAV